MYVQYLRQKQELERALSDLPVAAVIFWEGNQIKAISGTGTVIATSPSFRTVFMAALSHITSGGKIVIKSGTYIVDSPIILDWLNTKLIIEGEGPTTILKFKDNESDHPLQFRYSGSAYVAIRSLKFDGNKNNQNPTTGRYLACIYFSSFQNLLIDSVTFEDCYSYGIRSWNNYNNQHLSKNIIINNCRFVGVDGRPIGLAGGTLTGIYITNNFFSNCCTRFAVIFNNGRTGDIMLESSFWNGRYRAHDILISGNYFEDTATNAQQLDFNIAGIQLYGCEHATVIGNRITKSGCQGMLIISGREHTIIGNVISYCRKSGIYIEGNERTIVRGNIIKNNAGGIVIGAWTTGRFFTLTQRLSDSKGVLSSTPEGSSYVCSMYAGEIANKIPAFLTWGSNARYDVIITDCSPKEGGGIHLTIDRGWGGDLPAVGTNMTLVTGIRSHESVCDGNFISGNNGGGVYCGGADRVLIANNMLVGNLQSFGFSGVVTTRNGDDSGTFTLDPGFPSNEGTICSNNLIMTGYPIDVVWENGARIGMTVVSCIENTVGANGGTGDPLPPVNTPVTVSTPYGSAEITCYGHNCRIVNNIINTLPPDARRVYHFSNILNSGNRGSYNVFAYNTLLTEYHPYGYVWVEPPRFPFEIADKVIDNAGFITQNSGIAIIPSGQNSVVVPHGLSVMPNRVFCNGTHPEVASVWVSNITDTNIEISVNNNVTSNRTVYWYAKREY